MFYVLEGSKQNETALLADLPTWHERFGHETINEIPQMKSQNSVLKLNIGSSSKPKILRLAQRASKQKALSQSFFGLRQFFGSKWFTLTYAFLLKQSLKGAPIVFYLY